MHPKQLAQQLLAMRRSFYTIEWRREGPYCMDFLPGPELYDEVLLEVSWSYEKYTPDSLARIVIDTMRKTVRGMKVNGWRLKASGRQLVLSDFDQPIDCHPVSGAKEFVALRTPDMAICAMKQYRSQFRLIGIKPPDVVACGYIVDEVHHHHRPVSWLQNECFKRNFRFAD